jgi:iron complex outermembrane receptor protein
MSLSNNRALGLRKFCPSAIVFTSFFSLILLSLAEPLSAAEAVESTEKDETQSTRGIEEVLVTANRRAQNLQEMAAAVAVIGGESLERAGAGGFQDYVFKVPGVDMADSGASKKIAMRGVSNMSVNYSFGTTTSPIGIYLNDMPIQGDGVLPDLDLYDLQRIEVLKGPQGTLYGEGAQGGLMKMLLNTAVAEEFIARAEVGIGRTHNSGEYNNFQKAMINVPLPFLDTWAVRIVGSRRFDAGYIDYFNIPEDHANDVTNEMGRIRG